MSMGFYNNNCKNIRLLSSFYTLTVRCIRSKPSITHIINYKLNDELSYVIWQSPPTTFSVEESRFLLFSGRSGLNFNTHLMDSLTKDRVTSLKDLCMCVSSTKKLVEEVLISKIWNRSLLNSYLIWRSSFQNMFTNRCNHYVTFSVANNTSWNNLKHEHKVLLWKRYFF